MSQMFSLDKNINEILCFITIINVVTVNSAIIKEDNSSTTENYKNELFNAMLSIFQILREHLPEHHQSQTSTLNLEYVTQKSLISPSNKKVSHPLTYFNNNEKTFNGDLMDYKIRRFGIMHNKKKQNKLDKKIKTRYLDSENNEISLKDMLKTQQGDRRQEDNEHVHKKAYQNAKYEPIIAKSGNKIVLGNNFEKQSSKIIITTKASRKMLHDRKLLELLNIKNQSHTLSPFKNVNPKLFRKLNKPEFRLKSQFGVKYATNFTNASPSSYENNIYGNNYALNKNFSNITTPKTKYYIQSNVKSFSQNYRDFNPSMKFEKSLLNLNGNSEIANIVKKHKTNLVGMNDDHKTANTSILRDSEHQQSKTQAEIESHKNNAVHGSNSVKMKESQYRKSFLSNIVLPTKKQYGILKSRNIIMKLTRQLHPILLDTINKNETDSSSLFSLKHDEMSKHFGENKLSIDRKERIAVEDSRNKSDYRFPVYHKAMSVMENAYKFFELHTTVLVTILSTIVLVILLVVILMIRRRIKRNRYKDEDEPLLTKNESSVVAENSPAMKKRLQRNTEACNFFNTKSRKKSGSSHSPDAARFYCKENDILFSICSDDGSPEEDELRHSKDNFKSKKSGFSSSRSYFPGQKNESDLRQERGTLKKPGESHHKLVRLHRNFLERDGNVCYTDVIKRMKMGTKFQQSELFQENAVDEDSLKIPISILYGGIENMNEQSDSDTEKDELKQLFYENMQNGKSPLSSIKRGTKIKAAEDLDNSNPFHESSKLGE